MECVYRVQYTCSSVSNACRVGARCKNLVSVWLFHMQRGRVFFPPLLCLTDSTPVKHVNLYVRACVCLLFSNVSHMRVPV